MMAPPKHSNQLILSYPADHVLLLTLNRPDALNAISPQLTDELHAVLNWFEDEPSLWVIIITGSGRLFCAGADLKDWDKTQQSGDSDEQSRLEKFAPGFAAISRRDMVKPIIAAVNGGAYGGGMELILNCDLVVAEESAKFALPEVKRGVLAVQGGIPRLAKIAGHQRASEMLLLGQTITAKDAYERFGFVNRIVPLAQVIPTALELAKAIVQNSPDSIQSTKRGLLMSNNYGAQETVARHNRSAESTRVYKGDNIKEGLRAFNEKRAPKWSNPAKL
ncbi:ClpP/crotonase-like domain-containing protein [Mycena floridula]|nr:ClpP/crotonase-like domain-containing protein [Mycena floridula]